ncbi:hypothetical protein GGTG_09276 [Gaeumannomyces tritici R3-111a-1]|uniref:LysM domain-containing protein n=1 Tax=Gaeumannomyces tritici (strain R3-111a-1) TaxID=644352 RepID=J3P6Y0_GAET3|nr:hypothetical protein GGTG_09276 [Gaeumannomyces tritici R3-111a-1]EJT72410.1 hypothetical protein GGTG_09276 [Gaeumannomyces tritici R3-111a-1]
MLHNQPRKHYIQAIHARFIISNNLSRISKNQPPDNELPWQIWYPTRAAAETYVELARRRPYMRPAVARALIARASPNPHYLADLYARKGMGIPERDVYRPEHNCAIPFETCFDLNLQSTLSVASVDGTCYHEPEGGPGIYNGYGGEEAHADNVKLYIATKDEARPPNDGKGDVNLPHLWEEQIRGGFSEEGKKYFRAFRVSVLVIAAHTFIMVRISGQSRAVLLTASLAKLATAAQAACVFFWQANPGDTCQSIARDWSLTAHQFVALNPSVGPACANGVTSGVEYCVMGDPETGGPATTTTKATTRPPTSTSAPPTTLLTSTSTTAPPTTTQDPNIPSPTQPGTIEGCRSYYEVVEGDDCETVQRKHNNRFSMEEFYFWNPEVGGAACGNLWTEYYVCVDADARLPTPTGPSLPGPTQPGVVGFCTEFHKAQEGEVCSTVAERYGNRFPLKQL